MKNPNRRCARRSFLQSASAGLGMAWASQLGAADTGAPAIELGSEHQRAVNRRRRIVVQYDAQTLYGRDFEEWIDYRFRYADEPGTQIDSIWWDLGRLGQVLYPSKFLDPLAHAGLDAWRRRGIDMVARLVEETRRRRLEVFWHHRVSEVDLNPEGTGAAWKSGPAPLKRAHADWVLKTWWAHGLWNFAVPAVREHTRRCLEEVVQRYDLDGVQLDFARHVPCLPPGRQWELRDHVTALVRSVRMMLQEQARKRGRPLLLAAKVPRNLEGCRIDGFDVQQWARENLVDILTLGSRSVDVDLAAYRQITAGRNIKLQPCFDDHHTTDGYRYPPIEVFRGVFGNWWQQGADSVATFNWSNAPPEACKRIGELPGPPSQRQAYHEVGSHQTLQAKDKTFVVERRGGYPWAEGFFNRNETAPLPLPLAPGNVASVRVRIGDDLGRPAARLRNAVLRLVLFGAAEDTQVEVRLNGNALPPGSSDPAWKDPQIFSPRPQPASGGNGDYRIDPSQRLLRLDYAVDATCCRLGENQVDLRMPGRPPGLGATPVALEKLEVHVHYA